MARAKVRKLCSPKLYNAELTEGEVDFILGLLVNVGGDKVKSPAKYADRIERALTRITGYTPDQTDAFHLSYGHVHFSDYGTRPKPLRFDERLQGFMDVLNNLPNDELARLVEERLVEHEKNHPIEFESDKFLEKIGEDGLIRRTVAAKPHAGPRRRKASRQSRQGSP